MIDDELDELLAGVAAISLEGAKGVGKSATTAERVDAEFRLESPAVRALVEADPDRILDGRRVLLDEWQYLPFTWDLVRRAVDAGATPGQFLLTGSASVPDPGRHSGAGRILQLRMRPLALIERGYEPSVSLADLLTGRHSPIAGETEVNLRTYTGEIVASGFPCVREFTGRLRRARTSTNSPHHPSIILPTQRSPWRYWDSTRRLSYPATTRVARSSETGRSSERCSNRSSHSVSACTPNAPRPACPTSGCTAATTRWTSSSNDVTAGASR